MYAKRLINNIGKKYPCILTTNNPSVNQSSIFLVFEKLYKKGIKDNNNKKCAVKVKFAGNLNSRGGAKTKNILHSIEFNFLLLKKLIILYENNPCKIKNKTPTYQVYWNCINSEVFTKNCMYNLQKCAKRGQ